MGKDVSKDFIKGHDAGYKSAKNWESKSELEKWTSTIHNEIVGPSKESHSKDYKSGNKTGWKDYYK